MLVGHAVEVHDVDGQPTGVAGVVLSVRACPHTGQQLASLAAFQRRLEVPACRCRRLAPDRWTALQLEHGYTP